MRTCMLVGAEAREFDGIIRRVSGIKTAKWAGIDFVRECTRNGDLWLLTANGPGPKLAKGIFNVRRTVDAIISIGFCGALDPALHIGDIVVSGEVPKGARAPYIQGEVLSLDRVAITVVEKRRLREDTGASAVEMESAAVACKAREWGVPFRCVRVISDLAGEDMPLDFNLYRDPFGRFDRMRIATAALRHPVAVLPGLMRLERNCRRAAERLGEFLADCQF